MNKIFQIGFKSSQSFLPKLPKLIPAQRKFSKTVKVGKDWRDLLDTWSVHEILKKRPFVAVRRDDTIATLQKSLFVNGVLSAVVVDESKKPDAIVGCVDVLDWVHEMTQEIGEKASREQLVQKGGFFFDKSCGTVMNASGKDPVVKVLATDSLSKAVDMLEEVHRVVAYDASLRPIGIIAQSDIINFMLNVFDYWKSLLDMPLTAGGDESQEVLTVNENDSVIKALKIMKANRIHGIGVTNNHKELVTNLSASDFITLSPDTFSLLALSVSEFLNTIHGFILPPVYARDGYDSYHTIMLKMKHYGVHRVFVLDKKKRPIRVITSTDIMKVLVNPEHQTIMLPKKI